jgi:primosomal protein N' (replication factor Y)
MTLFGSLTDPPVDGPDSCEEKIISVAIPRPLHGLFTYKVPANLLPKLELGGCIKISFGRSTTHAFIVEPARPISSLSKDIPKKSLKNILEVTEGGAVFPPDVLALCRWASEYYATPLGEVLNCALSSNQSSNQFKKGPRPPSLSHDSVPRHSLTSDQEAVVTGIDQLRIEKGPKVALLHGITGSGKTEVYIELAKRTLEMGQGVLILVPEIALTSQLHRRFEEGLGVPVGLWHSAVSAGKRRDQIEALRSGKMKVVVGARSAVFAPIQNLGMTVVDEEHDPTYKQEDRVRYHARDLAIVRAKLTQSLTVLGSATPSFESRERVREGRYFQFDLHNRIAESRLPDIELVDLIEEERVPNIQAPLAQKTLTAIQETLDRGEQVIVYLNRRGFAAFLLCKDCGEVKNCSNCSISLTVHRFNSELRCHVCGHHEAIPDFCGKCSGTQLKAMGAGTESLEAEFPNLLTQARILRLDRDQVTSSKRLESILNSFRKGEANLLLGTQMLVKGHDFPGVTLVVVVLADGLFRWPDFRAHERAFQVLRQVSGRAGRGGKPGRVLIQTFDVTHPVLAVIQGKTSEDSFLESERELRQALGYPPFGRLARFRFENPSKEEGKSQAFVIFKQMEALRDPGLQILGPSEAFMEKVNGIYRWDLLIKSKDVQSIQRAAGAVRAYGAAHKIQYLIDIDPYGI